MEGNGMRRAFAAIPALAALVLLVGCSEEPGVENVSSEEAAELNNATEMLDASPDSMTAPENIPLETESNSAAPIGNGA